MTPRSVRRWAAWVAEREIWPLVAGAALATFTERWAGWGLGLIGLLWLVRWVGRGHLTIRTPVDWPVGVILLMIPVTFYATTDRQATLVQTSRLLAGLALTYGLANWARRESQVALVILGLSGIGLALGVVTPVVMEGPAGQLGAGIPGLDGQLRSLAGGGVNANVLAGALVMLVPLPLSLLVLSPDESPRRVWWPGPGFLRRLMSRRRVCRLGYGAGASVMVAALAATRSRSGWATGVMVVYVVLARRWPRLMWLIPVGLLGLGFVAWQQGLVSLLDWIATSGAVSGWDRRVEIWSRALYMIQDFAFTGIGAGTFREVANVLYPFFLAGPDADIPHAHNILLQVAVDLGFPGLIALVAVLLLAFWSALRSARFYARVGDTALAAVAWGCVASLVGMLMHGMVHASTWIVGRASFVPWAVMGVIFAMQNERLRGGMDLDISGTQMDTDGH